MVVFGSVPSWPRMTGRRNSSTRKRPVYRVMPSRSILAGRVSPDWRVGLRVSVTEYMPSLAAFGRTKLDSAWRPPRQLSGKRYSSPLPSWVTVIWSGNCPAFGNARQRAVSTRRKCFIDTVSPARNSGRSNTVLARTVGCGVVSVGTGKRHGSIPWFQPERTKDTSSRPCASFLRAVTNSPYSPPSGQRPASSSGWSMRATPCASVLPCHNSSRRQS